MSLDLPVFELRKLVIPFYYFFVFSLIFAAFATFFSGSLRFLLSDGTISTTGTWILFAILIIPSFMYSSWAKKELLKITSLPDINLQFAKYEQFFKKRLIWNCLSIAITAVFLLLTGKKTFLYLLILQLILSLLFYPNKKVITKELRNPDIVFT